MLKKKKKVGEDWNVYAAVECVRSCQCVICPECVCFQSGFISICIYDYTFGHTSHAMLHTVLLFLAQFSLPDHEWNPFCYWQNPVNLSLFFSHTHSFSSFMAKLLFFHSPSGYSCSPYLFLWFYSVSLLFMDTNSEILEEWILYFSEVC